MAWLVSVPSPTRGVHTQLPRPALALLLRAPRPSNGSIRALGNIKAAIVGTYRAIDQKHVPRHLAEFEYRFNRRYDLAAMMPRLTWSSVRTTPMPYRLLKLADVYA